MINELLIIDTIALTMLYNRYINNKFLDDFELRIGYRDFIFIKKPIVIDMRITPHIFISGLSGQGKTKMAEYMFKDKNVILINVFKDNLQSINAKRINGNDNILNFFLNLFDDLSKRDENSEPLYILIDELLVLSYDKKIVESIFRVLSIGRHYNLFLAAISQSGTKESFKFKDLFNTRICFRQVEESSYRAVLGYSPEDKNLSKREFYLYSDKIFRGFTYTV